MTSFEPNRQTLFKLCWMIAQQWKAELAYDRAKYRVSYYRKLKNSKKISKKWNNKELAKKIESERLISLKKQKQLLNVKKQLRNPILTAKNSLVACFTLKKGRVIGFAVLMTPSPQPGYWQHYDAYQIVEMSDQYEADCTLDKILVKNIRQKSVKHIQKSFSLEEWLPEDGYDLEENEVE